MNKLPIYKVKINDDEEIGVNAIALVESPAIEVDWVAFNKQERIQFSALKDKQMLAGPFLIPDFPIYRSTDKLGEYYVVFDKETIEQIAQKFNKQLKNNNLNLEHSTTAVKAFVAENWIIEGKNDKSNNYNYDLPEGTWFGLVKVEDLDFWTNNVKEGTVKGFSVEGLLGLEEISLSSINKEIEFQNYVIENIDNIGISKQNFSIDTDEELGEWIHLEDTDLVQTASNEIDLDLELAAKYTTKTLYTYQSTHYGSLGYGVKSRPFCKAMVQLSGLKYLTREDINKLSEKAGYSVFTQAGGNNCKHYWMKTTTRKKINLNKNMKEIILKDGTKIYAEKDVTVDAVLYSDSEGKVNLKDGTYELESGEMFTIVSGKVTEITQPTEAAATEPTSTTDTPVEEVKPDALEEIRKILAELNTRISALEQKAEGVDTTAEQELSKVKSELEVMKEALSKTPGNKSLFNKTDKTEVVKTKDTVFEAQMQAIRDLNRK